MQECFDYFNNDRWSQLQQQSYAERWNRLVQFYCLDKPHKDAEKKMRKELVRHVLHRLRQNVGGVKVEMCSNCFVRDTDLPQGTTLSKCSKCRRVKFCGRDCQVER